MSLVKGERFVKSPKPKSRSAGPTLPYVAVACWLDLLGYGTDIDKAGFDPAHPLASRPLKRLRAFQRIVSDHSNPGFPTLVMNDGAVAYSNVDPSRSDSLWRFIERCWRLYEEATASDHKSGGPGLRGVIAVGLRAKGSNRGIIAQDQALTDIIDQLVAGAIDQKRALLDIRKVRRVFDIIPQLQANFAFTRAYEAETAGSSAGLPGPALYLDTRVFARDVPHWVRSGAPIAWRAKKSSLATSFVAIGGIGRVDDEVAHSALRSGGDLRAVLKGLQPVWTEPRPADPCLYKYTSFDTAQIILSTGRLRWTTPPLLNDPYDLSFDLHLDYDHTTVRDAAVDLLWSDWRDNSRPAPQPAFEAWKRLCKEDHPALDRAEFAAMVTPIIEESIRATASLPHMQAELQSNLQRVKLLCLTETPTNILMWSHYGQQHYGAVLRFTRDGDNNAFSMARPVRYARGMPLFGDSEALARMITGRRLDAKALTDSQIYTKAIEWKYEREWRMQLGLGRDRGALHEDLPFGDELLTGVVMGCRMAEAQQIELAALARHLNPDIELFRAQPAARAFEMTVVPWTDPVA
jgi:hypothetical protein